MHAEQANVALWRRQCTQRASRALVLLLLLLCDQSYLFNQLHAHLSSHP